MARPLTLYRLARLPAALLPGAGAAPLKMIPRAVASQAAAAAGWGCGWNNGAAFTAGARGATSGFHSCAVSHAKPHLPPAKEEMFGYSGQSGQVPPGRSQLAGGRADEVQPQAGPTMLQRVKAYGVPGIMVYLGLGVVDTGLLYLAISNGVDVVHVLQTAGVPTEWLTENANTASTLAPLLLAYSIHKVLAPARVAVALMLTPTVVKWTRGGKSSPQ